MSRLSFANVLERLEDEFEEAEESYNRHHTDDDDEILFKAICGTCRATDHESWTFIHRKYTKYVIYICPNKIKAKTSKI